jgi:hypothetical protein
MESLYCNSGDMTFIGLLVLVLNMLVCYVVCKGSPVVVGGGDVFHVAALSKLLA